MKTSGVYAMFNLANGHAYVGSALKINRRRQRHLRDLRRGTHDNPHLQAAWKMYGEKAFVFVVLAASVAKGSLIALEQFYFKALRPDYNMLPVAGSRLGSRHTPETRAKMSARRKGVPHSPEHSAAIAAALRGYGIGRRASPETKAILSLSHAGKPRNAKGQYSR